MLKPRPLSDWLSIAINQLTLCSVCPLSLSERLTASAPLDIHFRHYHVHVHGTKRISNLLRIGVLVFGVLKKIS